MGDGRTEHTVSQKEEAKQLMKREESRSSH